MSEIAMSLPMLSPLLGDVILCLVLSFEVLKMQSYSTTEIRVTITKMDTGDYIGLNFDCITQ